MSPISPHATGSVGLQVRLTRPGILVCTVFVPKSCAARHSLPTLLYVLYRAGRQFCIKAENHVTFCIILYLYLDRTGKENVYHFLNWQ